MRKIRLFIAAFLVAFFIAIPCYAGNQTTSATLASTIITNARSYLNEATASFWTDAQMLVWLNDGTMDIFGRTHCGEDTEAETLVAAQISYPLTDPFILIKGVIYNSVKALRKGSIEHIGDINVTVGEPSYWTQWENNVIVYPAPDATAAGNTIDVYTIERPLEVASSANVLVPDQYDKALTLYIVEQGLIRDEKYEKAAKIRTDYLAELERYQQDFNTQPQPKEIR